MIKALHSSHVRHDAMLNEAKMRDSICERICAREERELGIK